MSDREGLTMSNPPGAQLTHVGLFVEDMDKMASFYQRLMGMVVTDEGEFLGKRLTFLSRKSDEHHQLVLVTGRKVPEGELQLLSQVSFRLAEEDLDALRWFRDTALELGVKGMEGRNHGNSWSIYFEDPEGNRLEIYTPTRWYVSQPWRVALDLDQPDEVIRAETLKLIEETATWQPAQVWQQELAARLGQEAGA
jgi:catechol 2,3-dioxygenase